MTAASVARLAGLLADRTRAGFCLTLLDGRAWTVGELARAYGVAPATASSHLDKLVDGGLLVQHRQGRHRYVRLANPDVARLVEELTSHAGPQVAPTGSLRAVRTGAALARGRTCYDHLAGRLGVLLVDAMTSRELLVRDTGFALTDAGLQWLADLGIDVATLRSARRPLVRQCVDWTERRPHLAGGAGAAICRRFFDAGWIRRVGGTRAVRVTPAGWGVLRDALGLAPDDLEPAVD